MQSYTEELAFAQKRNMKRRLMENNQVGAEVRRIHVIYFLSRKGRIEHPHLIRVHHLSRNGVHLRDVKRWLAELRGKDMPESFAWSYKRRYKSGYVWQDLLDEDLITPISDNEYVLKGSENSSTDIIEDSHSETKYSMQKDEQESDGTPSSKEENQDHLYQKTQMEEPTKISSQETEEESPTFLSEKSSTLTDDSIKIEDQDQEKHIDDQSSKQEIHEESDKIENPNTFCKTFSNKKSKKDNKIESREEKISTPSSATTSTSQPTFSKSRSYSNGASHLFRNLITCGAVDTNDSAMVTINRRNKPCLNNNLSSSIKMNELQKGDKLGGSQRIFGANWNQQRQNSGRKSFDGVRASPKNKSEFSNQKANAAYKPIFGPQCSQCGKPFKPEKLHAHMKSCKGMKAWAKYSGPAISAEKTTEVSAGSPHTNMISGYYLTH
ncbi:hypothetical protein ACH5RR_000637 [Cinchona calisaya]|uniref:SOSEKI DIX-like domain-containing protein n=1 Tax=Cinchona calisaya TaxID=153742 RepID=A0ABD3B1F2_9GENT